MNKEKGVVLYKSDTGETSLEVRVLSDSVWLSLDQLASLYKRDKSVVSRHVNNTFKDKELQRSSVVAFFATTADDGKTRMAFSIKKMEPADYRTMHWLH